MPPVYLIGRTIFHLEACGARGVLVVPYWPLAVFWPIVFPLSGNRASIVQCIEFLTLVLFSHPLVRDTRLFSVHLDSGRQFWLSASMVPLVFPDKLVSSHPVGGIFFLSCFSTL